MLESAPAYIEVLLEELKVEMAAICNADAAEAAKSSVKAAEADAQVAAGLETIYTGGGTPTLLGGGLLSKVLAVAGRLCQPGAEITVEANPSTVSRELAASLAESGVNRVSLGAQSFVPELRNNLGRRGTPGKIGEAVADFRAEGIGNIGLDLMFGIPGQDKMALKYDLENVLALEPMHISCYELTVKESSPFQQRWQRELEDAARTGREAYETVVETLEVEGFRWYETSNFARPGFECRHNLAYWHGDDFIGLGAGAWSSTGDRRWRNVEDIKAYMDCASRGDWAAMRTCEQLSGGVRDAERLMLGLRLDVGVERAAVAGAIDAEQEKLLLRNGFLVNEGGRISLTRQGRFVANEVCARLLRD